MKRLLLTISPKSIQYKSVIDERTVLLFLFILFLIINDVSLLTL